MRLARSVLVRGRKGRTRPIRYAGGGLGLVLLGGLLAPAHASTAGTATRGAASAAKALAASLGPESIVQIDSGTGTARVVARSDGYLTAATREAPGAVALDYVRAHRNLFGLSAGTLSALHPNRNYLDAAGISHLSWTQTVAGVPLFGHGLRANVARDGRLISVLGAPVPDLGAVRTTPTLSAAQALAAARREDSTGATRHDKASLVLFRTGGRTVLGWQTVTLAARASLHVVDAATGQVLYRQSLTNDANGSVFDYWPGYAGGQQAVSFTGLGWLPAGQRRRLAGNNAHVFSDVNSDDRAQPGEEVPAGPGGNWTFAFRPFPTSGTGPACSTTFRCSWRPGGARSWAANRAQNATQVFYYVNTFHDHLAAPPISFTEAAGNFQQVNRSGRGRGGDPVIAQPDDGANTSGGLPDRDHVNNANMSTPSDGIPPYLQTYLFQVSRTKNKPFLAANGGDEADVVYHEYTHGLSNRLVVDADGISTLIDSQALAMGEGWSDWYAMDYLVARRLQTDTPRPGEVLIGRYVSGGSRLVRTQPLDCPARVTTAACPGTRTAGAGGYTYADYGRVLGHPEEHADGEIWGETLWDLRAALGSRLAEQLITRSMELAPSDPSFLDMRDAILQADTATNSGRAHAAVWRVFADRGMGRGARTADGADRSPHADFTVPAS